jgi:hypothetical protein
MKVRIVKAG